VEIYGEGFLRSPPMIGPEGSSRCFSIERHIYSYAVVLLLQRLVEELH
jgi:hypothetical protein